MPEDEKVAAEDPEGTPEGEKETPSSEAVAESAVEGEPEDETPLGQKLRRIRDDTYRRVSNVESAVKTFRDEVLQEIRSLKTPRADDKDLNDPIKVRAKLASDPVGAIREVAREEAREVARTEALQERARQSLLQEFPELKDESHPFFKAVDQEYRLLTHSGNQGPDLPFLAAQRATMLHPELRENGMKDARRKTVEDGARKVATTKVEAGVSKPKKSEETPISDKERAIARRFGLNLSDEKQKERFLRERKYVADFRLGVEGSKSEE